MNFLEKILTLIHTEENDTIDLAFELAKSQNIDLEEYYNFAWFQKHEIKLEFVENGKWKQVDNYSLKDLLLNMKELDISEKNHITKLPSQIGLFFNLESMYMEGIGITELPIEIGKLYNLVHLDISNTKITKLPAVIETLYNLEHLDISNTNIKELPPEIENIKTLERLYMSHTPIDKISEKLKNNKNLEITVEPSKIKKLLF